MTPFFKRIIYNKAGLSLVELLVVISIIGILVAIVYANFAQGKAATRDKVRQTTLVDIQLAVEQYKAQTGSYPVAGCGATSTQWATSDSTGGFAGADTVLCPSNQQFITGLVPSYMPALPDPGRPEGRGFYYRGDGNSYKLIVYEKAETLTITDYDHEFAACPPQEKGNGSPLCSGVGAVPALSRTYAVYSLGAEGW